ncbi:hypothetical protein BDZ85DRAFT_131926 [Elsinoe ampelina]|uniref:Uncharacterized protein n=1 Tax=Elsinoe ampelina TaxID=302913 RepID=A0A6A6FXR6_9PEZI|nr:hypothetical protein BDZ85DRAFT_131926 [Elsinoe ampelina]
MSNATVDRALLSPLNVSKEGLCKHTEYMVGCAACLLIDLRVDAEEARSQIQSLQTDLQDTQVSLQRPGLRQADHESLTKKFKELDQRLRDWTARQQGLRTLMTKAYRECAGF